MTVQLIISILKEFGFPIAVCIYFMWERQRDRQENRELREALVKQITINTEIVKTLPPASDSRSQGGES